tara:strand:- start:7964 stop:8785 length:822 start_codon:yes stop_codon:yes gene_type:complete
MALKAVLQGQEEFDSLPESVRDHYKESDGVFSLSVEGVTGRENELGAKVAEFRDTNVQLMKDKVSLSGQVEEMASKYQNVDPDVYRKLISDQVKLEKKDAKVVTNSDLTSQIQDAVLNAVKPIQAQLNEAKERESQAQSSLEKASFRNIVNKAAVEAGVRNEALDDVLGRALQVGFTLHDGSALIVNDGAVKFSPDKPDQPFSIPEWLVGLQRDGGSHLFKPSISTGDQDQSGPDVRLKGGNLKDPSVKQFARNLEAIASGKVTVTRSANRGE